MHKLIELFEKLTTLSSNRLAWLVGLIHAITILVLTLALVL